ARTPVSPGPTPPAARADGPVPSTWRWTSSLLRLPVLPCCQVLGQATRQETRWLGVGESQPIRRRRKYQLIGEHPDDFRFRDLATALGDECLDPLEHAHRRNGLDVLEVHRKLGLTPFLQHQGEGAQPWESSARLPDRCSDRLRLLVRDAVHEDVPRQEDLPCTDARRARTRVGAGPAPPGRDHIRLAIRRPPGDQRFVPPAPELGEPPAGWIRRLTVEVDRDAELLGDRTPDASRTRPRGL